VDYSIRYTEYYGLQQTFDNLYKNSKEGYTFDNLFKLIIDRNNILLAFRTIKSNKGSTTAGVDGKTIKHIKRLSEDQLVQYITNSIKNYQPNAVRRVYIPKPNGKKRPLGIPTIRDRIIQQAFKQILEPICEAKFYKHSYGFRPHRSAHKALGRAQQLINFTQCQYVVDVDIQGFFDNVCHKKLRRQIWSMGIKDKRILKIIDLMLKAEIEGEGIPNKGTPQGGILSPLLANIVLNEFDHWVASQWENLPSKKQYSSLGSMHRALSKTNLKRGYIVRYADDFKIFTDNYKSAIKWYHATKQWLKERLRLDISPDKSKITNLRRNKSEFLGFEIKAENITRADNKYVAKVYVSSKNIQKLTELIKAKIKLIRKDPSPDGIYKLNSIIRGVHNYYRGATNVSNDFSDIAFKVNRVMYNRLRKNAKYVKVKFKEKPYNKYNYKTFIVNKIPIIPIGAVKHEHNPVHNQNMIKYTEEGRTILEHYRLSNATRIAIIELSRNFIKGRTVEYNDNRISLFSAHNGRCYVTRKDLTEDLSTYHCHHKKPIYLEGDDSYKNLVPLHVEVHKLIHATKEETIREYKVKLNLTEDELKKINTLRKKCKIELLKI
jgi:group II intron reverse transcriptase/maturase